jgi:hypothetical protein
VPSRSRLHSTVNLRLVEHPLKIQSKNPTATNLCLYSTDDLFIDPPLLTVDAAGHLRITVPLCRRGMNLESAGKRAQYNII